VEPAIQHLTEEKAESVIEALELLHGLDQRRIEGVGTGLPGPGGECVPGFGIDHDPGRSPAEQREGRGAKAGLASGFCGARGGCAHRTGLLSPDAIHGVQRPVPGTRFALRNPARRERLGSDRLGALPDGNPLPRHAPRQLHCGQPRGLVFHRERERNPTARLVLGRTRILLSLCRGYRAQHRLHRAYAPSPDALEASFARLGRSHDHDPPRHRPRDLALEHGRAKLRQRSERLPDPRPLAHDPGAEAEPLAGVVAERAEAQGLIRAAAQEGHGEEPEARPETVSRGDQPTHARVGIGAAEEETGFGAERRRLGDPGTLARA
jgi:hypothetical protein